MNNTEKNTQAWPSELAHSSDPSPLARLGATWTPLRAPAAHLGPVSEQKLGQLVQRGPAHTRPAPWASTTPGTLCSPAGERWRAGARGTLDSAAQGRTPHLPPKVVPEVAVVALRGPGKVFSGASLLLRVPVGTTPPPCQPPAHLWWDPTASDAAPQRTNPHHRSRDEQDTREWTWQDTGSNLSCPEQKV